MKTSLIILFKNEVEYAEITMQSIYTYLSEHNIDFELIAVDDSVDGTWEVLKSFEQLHDRVLVVKGSEPAGYGKALRKGVSVASGDIIIPFNGDLSDSLDDVISYIQLIEAGNEMVFGSRFMQGAQIVDSKMSKHLVSRIANTFLQLLFFTPCSDITNSFKAYRRTVLEGIKLSANGYEIGMEIALKSILRQYKYTTIPISWQGRKYGRSKMSVLKVIPTYLITAFKIRLLKS